MSSESKRLARHRRVAPKAWRTRWRLKTMSALLALVAAFGFSSVAIMQAVSSARLAAAADAAARMPDAEQTAMINKAREYNKRLYKNGQRILGEASDPFAADASAPSEKDKDYQSQLNPTGDGTMGSVVIPRIDVKLPILHGTTQAILAKGAGHMYGTSLPVGGRNTHAVISAHNGLPNALMFTHLDEVRKGDAFYVKIGKYTFAYKVNSIRIIEPTDWHGLVIHKGKDEVTLMTCTPYGINSHRLLVTGQRARMPQVVPFETDAHYGSILLNDPFAFGAVVTIPIALAYTGRTIWIIRREKHAILGVKTRKSTGAKRKA